MYSKNQFTALEAMCREQAALARSEMEYSLMKYWLVEAEEWKQLSTVPQALTNNGNLRRNGVRTLLGTSTAQAAAGESSTLTICAGSIRSQTG
jgi:hypothetical protein